MADSRGKQSKNAELKENPLIAELLARGAENSTVLRGFIGPSRDDRYITLYQNLARLGDTVEVLREDVVHVIDAPGSPLGAVIIWFKDDAQIAVRRPQTDDSTSKAEPGARLKEIVQGRLRLQIGQARITGASQAAGDCDISWCDCSICTSNCITTQPQ